jgi:hypothetical protein
MEALIVSESEVSEAPTTSEVETVAAAADAAVEIAAIEAERDVSIAEIHAEATVDQTVAIVEAEAARKVERDYQGEIAEWQQITERLRATVLEQSEQLRSILSKLTPAEQPPSNLPESVASEATQDNPEEAALPPTEKPKKKVTRWI